jgi:hypothetical protein
MINQIKSEIMVNQTESEVDVYQVFGIVKNFYAKNPSCILGDEFCFSLLNSYMICEILHFHTAQ